MTKLTDNAEGDGNRPTLEIEVTETMITAGLEELREHQMGCDLGYLLECVFRAMAYARASASDTSAFK